MDMYDRNGLELTNAERESFNTYKFTAVDFKERKFTAYAPSTKYNNWNFCMHTIRHYRDPRDAAFVAQEFHKIYDRHAVSDMINAGTFREICNEFIENLDIPEWKYPAEGYTIEELLGEKVIYKKNYVGNAREALLEAFEVFNVTNRPSLDAAKKMMNRVEELYRNGMTYRQAAAEVIQNT